ncbi:MAG: M24 family metallopeptidase, partial [Halobacteriaceae archaeon]
GAVRRAINVEIAKRGLEPSFPPVVAFGEAAAIPHYNGDEPLGTGFLLIDMGVKYNGYCSDITRTVYIGGEPSEQEQSVYEQVQQVQDECISKASPGQSCSALFNHAKDALGEKFNHGLGHGLGVEIHEIPNLKEESEDELEESMVLTIEPGWYDDFGVRIEDDILITDNGCERLTTTPHAMYVSEY